VNELEGPPENIGALEGFEFGHIKHAFDALKHALKGIEGMELDADIKRLPIIKKDLQDALCEIKRFTDLLNTEHDVLDDIREKSRDISKKL
jgi:hypothetical protein